MYGDDKMADKPTATATPAAAETKPEDVKVGTVQATATTDTPKTDQPKPEVKTTGQETQQASAEKKQLTPDEKRIKAMKRDLWERAERERALAAELKAIKEQMANTKPAPAVDAKPAEPELLDNPAEWAKRIEEQAATRAEQSLMAKLEAQREAERLKAERDEGVDLILSHQVVKDNDDASAQIVEILHEPIFAHIAAKYPKIAAERALEEFIKRNGMGAERKAAVAANLAATQTTTITAAPTDAKTWKRSEIQDYIAAGGTMAEITKRRVEIQAAIKEGRVK
jgi:hypothetical protein